MKRKSLHPVLAYGVAVAAVAAVTFLRTVLDHAVGGYFPFILFYLAVIVSVYVGGRRPGVVAALLSILAADYFFLPPRNTFLKVQSAEWFGLAVFALVCAIVIVATDRLRVAAHRAARESAERKEAERKSRFLATIVQSSDDAIMSIDPDGTITTWNRAAEKLFGYTSAEAVGRSVSMLVPVPCAEDETRILKRINRGEDVAHYDTVRRHKDGRSIDVSLSIAPIRDDAGRVIGAAKIVRSIATRRAAERRARAENAAIRAIANAGGSIDAAHALIVAVCSETEWQCGSFWRVAPTGDYIESVEFASVARCRETSELGRETLGRRFPCGQGLPGRVWAARRPVWIEEIVRDVNIPRSPLMIAAGVRSVCVIPVLVGDSFAGVLEFFSATPQPGDEAFLHMMGGLGAHLGHFMERRRVEEELRAAQQRLQEQASKLETTVEERTLALRQTLQGIEHLCYTIAHDLRAPLRAMQGFARALVEDYQSVLDETATDYAERIVKAAWRMDALITDLLAYGRLGTGDVTLLPVELNSVVNGFLTDYAEEVKARQATISVEPLMPVVIANRTMLAQVVANLLINAMKFVAVGVAPHIRVYTGQQGDRVRLFVEDNGIGIAAEHAGKLFHIFQRLHGPEQYAGTGIGLAIVKKAMERMSGSAGFTSTPGGGSTFWIDLRGAGVPSRQASRDRTGAV